MSTTKKIDFGLSEEIIDLFSAVFLKDSKIKKALVFGSRAKGNYRKGSDIDLAIIADDFSFDDMIHLQLEIDDLDLLYKVDCIDYDKIDNPKLKEHIDRVGKTLYP
ncbi:MAG: nucleotidyltransferase domain-containing protein [Cyclobacteriaceae bacterium]